MSAQPLTQGARLSALPPLCRSAIACAAAAAALAGCSSFSGASSRLANAITPYRVEIVQGNFVSREQLALLQPGMAKAQVRELLGTPLLTSVFHSDRWDYVFTLRRQGVEAQTRKLAVFFKGELLDRTEGDEMPTEAEFVSQIDTHRNLGKVPLLEVPEEVLKEFSLKNPPAAPAVAVTTVAAALPASFPPLEAPGTQTQAWDASTQRAVAAATARPAAAPAAPLVVAPVAAPAVVAVAPAPVAAAPAAVQPQPVVPAAVPAPAPARPVVAAASPAAPVAGPSAPPAAAPVAVAGTVATVAAAAAVAAPPVVARAAPASAPAVPAAAPAAPVAALPAPVAAPAPLAPPPRPVAAAPAAPVVASSNAFSSLEPELGGFLTGWMNDWQSRNANAFFARYAPEFTGSSASRAEWEALRRPRIESRLSISIGVLDVRARMVSPTEARVVFRQAYESDAGSEIGTKAMFLSKRDGRWLIDREFFTPAQ